MKNNIEQKIVETFEVLDKVEKVTVSHFFSHKVLQKIQAEQQEKKQTVFSWFTPSLQLATLGLVLLVNAATLFYSFSGTDDNSGASIETFAQEYALQIEDDTILN